MRRILVTLLLVGSVWADELKRPTTDIAGSGAGCVGAALTSGTIPLAYDVAGPATSSNITAFSVFTLPHGLGDGSRTQSKSRRITTWTASTNTYGGLSLNVLSSSGGATGTGGNACLAYSLNSGGAWTLIRCSGSAWMSVTDTVALPVLQDLTKLQVAACAQANGNDPDNESTDNLQLFDVWTLGTTAAQPAGNGSTAGQPHRGLVIAN